MKNWKVILGWLVATLLFFISVSSKAQIQDTTNTYHISFRCAAQPGQQANIIDNITNDTIEQEVTVQASTFRLACYKIRHWQNPRTGFYPYTFAVNFKDMTIK